MLSFWERVYFLSQHIHPDSAEIIYISFEVPVTPSCKDRGTHLVLLISAAHQLQHQSGAGLCRTTIGNVADGLLGVILSLNGSFLLHETLEWQGFKWLQETGRDLRVMYSMSLC